MQIVQSKITGSELVIKQLIHSVRNDKPDMDVAEVFEKVEKIIGRRAQNDFLLEAIQDHFRSTELERSLQSRKVSKQDVEILYQDLLGLRDVHKETFAEQATMIGKRVDDHQQLSILSDMSTAYIRRFQEIKYMHLDRTLPLAQRVDNISQLTLMHTLGTTCARNNFWWNDYRHNCSSNQRHRREHVSFTTESGYAGN